MKDRQKRSARLASEHLRNRVTSEVIVNKAIVVLLFLASWTLIHFVSILSIMFGLVYGVLRHFQQYFNYFVVVSFIGGGNWRKPQTCHKSLTNFIT